MLPNRVRGEYRCRPVTHRAVALVCWDMGEYRKRSQRLAAALGVAAAVMLGGCATLPDDPEARQAMREANDPIEPVNRWVFDFNQLLDRLVLRPLAQGYLALPEVARQGIANFLHNIDSPVILANDLMQAKPARAATTAARFVVNSTIGIGGLLDVASGFGWERHVEDFGQTLGRYRVAEGPYLVLPVVGPAPPRDAIGRIADTFLDPLSYLGRSGGAWISPTRFALEAIGFRARHFDQIDEIERTSIDFYATVRSAYRQRRNDDIRDGAPGPLVPVPRISIDFGDRETAATAE